MKAIKVSAAEVGKPDKSAVVNKSPVANANSPYSDIQDGKQLFKFTCGSCHTIGKGKVVGPDLEGVSERFDKEWLYPMDSFFPKPYPSRG